MTQVGDSSVPGGSFFDLWGQLAVPCNAESRKAVEVVGGKIGNQPFGVHFEAILAAHRLEAHAGGDHLGAFPDEQVHRPPPDSGRTARNHRHFSAQPACHDFLAVNLGHGSIDLTRSRF